MLTAHDTQCCGLREVCNFDGDVKSRAADLAGITKDVKLDAGAAFITLTQNQWPTYGALVRRRGFRLVAEFNNPNTHNNIRMYVRVLNKPLTGAEIDKLDNDDDY